jgi:nitric oxide reductase NorD protein
VAEAEDVITDAARHATVLARDLWRRHRPTTATRPATALQDIAARLDLLLVAVFGHAFEMRVAEPPAPATFLTKVFRSSEGPRSSDSVPATDGRRIWLPSAIADHPSVSGEEQLRVMALQQAQRACSGCVAAWQALREPVEQAVFLVLQAQAADARLVGALPGMRGALEATRALTLVLRPPLAAFPTHRMALEKFVRNVLGANVCAAAALSQAECLTRACAIAAELREQGVRAAGRLLYRDLWTGEVRQPEPAAAHAAGDGQPVHDEKDAPHSARLSRRPRVREAQEGEDDKQPGAWMVQTGAPHEQAEDPHGLQRPTDRNETTAAQELADSLSELPEARLVSAPGRPKEILLSQEPPPGARVKLSAPSSGQVQALSYPEWDWRAQAYRERGVTVHVSLGAEGPQAWVDAALEEHRSTANLARRRFEMLRAQRLRLRQQVEGDEVDIEAYVGGFADFRAGYPLPQGLYQACRRARRDMAVLVLIDVSGSTDAWVAGQKRVIDVERPALLLVSIALQGLSEPNASLAFSGEGPHGVVIRVIKSFDEPFGPGVARRIAQLEPERYTRAGAALRHATVVLMQQAARHRLLLMVSDGKPNDVDDYEGRYGVEDMRQAVAEARLQGVHPFCLTVDRQAAAYLSTIFGANHYALLHRVELLPTALLSWMRRLVQT